MSAFSPSGHTICGAHSIPAEQHPEHEGVRHLSLRDHPSGGRAGIAPRCCISRIIKTAAITMRICPLMTQSGHRLASCVDLKVNGR